MNFRIQKRSWEQVIFLDDGDSSQMSNTVIKLNQKLELDSKYLKNFVEMLIPDQDKISSKRGGSIDYIVHAELELKDLSQKAHRIVEQLSAQVPEGYHFRHIGFCMDEDLKHSNIEIKYSNYHHRPEFPKNLSSEKEKRDLKLLISTLVSEGVVPRELVLNLHVKHKSGVSAEQALPCMTACLSTKRDGRWNSKNLTEAINANLENFGAQGYSVYPNPASQRAYEEYQKACQNNAPADEKATVVASNLGGRGCHNLYQKSTHHQSPAADEKAASRSPSPDGGWVEVKKKKDKKPDKSKKRPGKT